MKNLLTLILGFAISISAQAQSLKYNIFTTNTPAGFTNGPGIGVSTNGGVFGLNLLVRGTNGIGVTTNGTSVVFSNSSPNIPVTNGVGISSSTVNGTNTISANIVGAGGTSVITNGNQLIISNNASGGSTLTNASLTGTLLVNANTNAILTLQGTNGVSVFTNSTTTVFIGRTNSGEVVQRKIVVITNRYAFTATAVGVTTNASSTVGQPIITNSFTATNANNRLRMVVSSYVSAGSTGFGIIGIMGGGNAASAFDTHYIGTIFAGTATLPLDFVADGLVEATTNINYVFRVAVDSGSPTVSINRRSDTDTSFGGTSKIIFLIEEYIP